MLYEADSAALIDFAKRWARLGDAITEQVEEILANPRAAAGYGRGYEEVNPTAIAFARERLQGLNEELDTAFDEYFALRAERQG